MVDLKYPSQTREAYREYYQKNREKILETNRRWRANNRSKHKMHCVTWITTHPIRYLLRIAQQRALKKGLEFTVTEEHITIPEVCPILNVPFERNTPYAMSLDRKDSSKGYIPGNVWVISKKANSMKSNATPEELRAFAQWVIFNV